MYKYRHISIVFVVVVVFALVNFLFFVEKKYSLVELKKITVVIVIIIIMIEDLKRNTTTTKKCQMIKAEGTKNFEKYETITKNLKIKDDNNDKEEKINKNGRIITKYYYCV